MGATIPPDARTVLLDIDAHGSAPALDIAQRTNIPLGRVQAVFREHREWFTVCEVKRTYGVGLQPTAPVAEAMAAARGEQLQLLGEETA